VNCREVVHTRLEAVARADNPGSLIAIFGLGHLVIVPHSQSGAVPMSSLLGVGQLGVLGNWKGWDNWVKGGANRVSLQAT
jgi:hypothetical protein